MAPTTHVDREPSAPGTLAGLAEIAEILGVRKNTALKHSRRPDFPEPLDRLASGPVWQRTDVERWKREHWPLPTGRPRTSQTPSMG